MHSWDYSVWCSVALVVIEMEIHLKLFLCLNSQKSYYVVPLKWRIFWIDLKHFVRNLCYLAFVVFIFFFFFFISSVHFYIASLCSRFYDCWKCFWWQIIKPCEYNKKNKAKSCTAGKIKETYSNNFFFIFFQHRFFFFQWIAWHLNSSLEYIMCSYNDIPLFLNSKPAKLSIQWKCKFLLNIVLW